MTAAAVCFCKTPMRPQANYCPRCGRELRQNCPLCYEERRLLAKLEAGASPWCANRGELLAACERCGRWLTADTGQCPDPACRGRVGPTWPVTTGRNPDGSGQPVGGSVWAAQWRWPAVWDRQNGAYQAPVRHDRRSDDPVHAACIAHGRCYVWAGDRLEAPSGAVGGPLATGQTENEADSLCWLGLDGRPNPRLPIYNRLAVIGGGIVLAVQNEFLLTGLYPHRKDNQFVPLPIGEPLAQIAAGGWWAGWSRDNQRPALWVAAAPHDWRAFSPQPIAAPDGAMPRDNAALALHNGIACWIGADGAIWQLDCRCRDLQRITEPMPGLQRVWFAGNGWHTARATSDGLRIGLDAVLPDAAPREAAGGAGPSRDLFASPALLAVVSDGVTTLDAQTGDVIGGGKYTGRWITGLLADAQPGAADPGPRLLMLVEENGNGNLSALQPLTGAVETVWNEAGTRPLDLLAAGDSLYVVHERGVTRLKEALP